MNKYLLLTLLLVFTLVTDLGSKTLAEDHLASAQYEHYLVIEIPEDVAEGTTVAEVLADEFGWSSEEEIDVIANQFTALVNENGNLSGIASASRPVVAGERLEVRHREIVIVEGFLEFRYVENRGAAWGFLSNARSGFNRPFFIIVGLLAVVIIFVWYSKLKEDRRFLMWSLGLIVGGALGNIVDRVRYGYVVDFIQWYPGFTWPTFNIADAWIVAGVAMMFIEAIREQVAHSKAKAAEKRDQDAAANRGVK